MKRLAEVLVLILAAARLTRLFTEDHLGRWYFQAPVEAWGDRHELAAINAATARIEGNQYQEDVDALVDELANYDASHPWTWQKRLSEGATCRWCVGFWLGVLLLTADALTRTKGFGWARPFYTFVVGTLALNAASNAVGKWTETLP